MEYGKEIQEPPDLDGSHFKARYSADIILIRAAVLKSFRQTLDERNFIEIQTPVLTSLTGACEDLSTLFSLPYFEQRAFLRQTSQLYLESFIYSEKTPRVFSFGPSFRAEPKVDNRRLTEFNLLEVEFADANLDSITELISSCLINAVSSLLENHLEQLQNLNADIEVLKSFRSFQRITYKEALKTLVEKGFDVSFGDDLNQETEQALTSHYGPLFVTHYPKKIKFFNMKENEEDPRLVNCVDAILPIAGESVGASEREESWEKLYHNLHTPEMEQAFEKVGGNCLDFKWYLDLRRPKPITHGGFGIGLERFIQFVLSADSIKGVNVYTRNASSISP